MYIKNNYIKKQIRRHALENPHVESCGLILKRKNSVSLVKCKNVSKTPQNHFLIDLEESQKFADSIVAFYHSHVSENAVPSMLDKLISRLKGVNCIVYSLKDDNFEEFAP